LGSSIVFWKPNRYWGLPVIAIDIIINSEVTGAMSTVMG